MANYNGYYIALGQTVKFPVVMATTALTVTSVLVAPNPWDRATQGQLYPRGNQ